MPVQREVFIPQAMQRHTGCAWVQPVCADDRNDKPKKDAAVAGRATEPEKP
jgi:hypothetical protein